jgi:hypothetical protein
VTPLIGDKAGQLIADKPDKEKVPEDSGYPVARHHITRESRDTFNSRWYRLFRLS